jgi:hypothetical protein
MTAIDIQSIVFMSKDPTSVVFGDNSNEDE